MACHQHRRTGRSDDHSWSAVWTVLVHAQLSGLRWCMHSCLDCVGACARQKHAHAPTQAQMAPRPAPRPGRNPGERATPLRGAHVLQHVPDVLGRAEGVEQPRSQRALEQHVDKQDDRIHEVHTPVVEHALSGACGVRKRSMIGYTR
eukprot:295072-Chlamydomonas_euryale.AAC.5